MSGTRKINLCKIVYLFVLKTIRELRYTYNHDQKQSQTGLFDLMLGHTLSVLFIEIINTQAK